MAKTMSALERLPSPLARSASSSPTATSSSSSNGSSSHSLDAKARSGVPELPSTVAWLEHASFEVSARLSKKFAACSSDFPLHVTFAPHGASSSGRALSWRVARSFDEYLELQQRLLKTLALGHACSAECRWLHSFVKNYFPKKARFFGNCSTRTANVRREKLARCLNVLKASLLNRGNHGCAVVVLQLAGEFDAFVQGNNRFALSADAASKNRPSAVRPRAGSHSSSDGEDEDERVRRCSLGSSASTSSTEAGDHEAHLGELAGVCDLCDASLDESPADACAPDAVFSCHTTTLSCGHQFHDACVLPELAALGYCCPSCNAPQTVGR